MVPLPAGSLESTGRAFYIRTSIYQSRKEYLMLLKSAQNVEQLIEENCQKHNLTAREIEIVNEIIKAKSYKLIAYSLHISEKTVAKHVSNIFSKASTHFELCSPLFALSFSMPNFFILELRVDTFIFSTSAAPPGP
jgi:DNA-binding CsgD family transcriptional regulator